MDAQLRRLNAKDPIEDIVAALQDAGGVIVEDLLDAEILGRLNDEIAPHLEAAEAGREVLSDALQWFFGAQTRHFTGLCTKSETFATDVLTSDVLCGVADAILLPTCVRYQLNIAHVLDRGPGSGQQLPHRDELVWCHLPRPHPEIQLASVIALREFTANNGATRVVPGSHRWDLERQPRPEEFVAAEMPAGAGVIYLGSTIHGGGPNTTDKPRTGVHVSYTLGWLRTEENHYLATPPDVARKLPRHTQELLGYAVHDALRVGGGFLGAVETQDPVDLLARGKL